MILVMHTPLFRVSKTQPGSVDLFSTVVNSSYAAHTKYSFALVETVAIAKLQSQGLTYEAIRQQVVVDDLLQIRSQASRQGAIRTIWQGLEKLPIEYIQLIATGHLDVRRFTVFIADAPSSWLGGSSRQPAARSSYGQFNACCDKPLGSFRQRSKSCS